MRGKVIEFDGRLALMFDIRDHDGYTNPFTREEAPQAQHKNGARIKKANSEKGDMYADGTLGTVLGSFYVPNVGTAYFVEWDAAPRVAIFIAGVRIAAQ